MFDIGIYLSVILSSSRVTTWWWITNIGYATHGCQIFVTIVGWNTDRFRNEERNAFYVLPGMSRRRETKTSPSLSPFVVNIDWNPLIGLLTENVDKFCTLAVPMKRFDSASWTLSISSTASKPIEYMSNQKYWKKSYRETCQISSKLFEFTTNKIFSCCTQLLSWWGCNARYLWSTKTKKHRRWDDLINQLLEYCWCIIFTPPCDFDVNSSTKRLIFVIPT